MLMPEDFLRCPNCKHNKFVVKKLVIVNKDMYEKYGEITENQTELTYLCAKCKEVLKPRR